MEPIKLLFPVETVDGRLLLPEGTVLNDENLNELLQAAPPASSKKYALMEHGSIKEDTFSFINNPPYDVIFSEPDCVSEIIDIMETSRFGSPVLDALDYFKEYDFPSYRHMLTIFALTILIAKDLVPNYRKRVSEIAYGPTHDFGKISVPLDILQKEQPLTRNELKQLKHHTIAGYVLLCYYFRSSRSIAAMVARDHHERLNGSGYPYGINQQDLIVEIVAVCDVYDALISPRPYRPVSYDNRTALEVLTVMAQNGEIGWRVVRALIAQNRAAKPAYKDAVVSLERRGKPPVNNVYGKVSEED
jgi:HD-GYP domain-containing protein (c-di-GMP phosphodiesterase class II)